MGKRPELIGGGLIRSAGGWQAMRSLRKLGRHLKGDERILGGSEFVESVLESQDEQLERCYLLQSKGYDIAKVIDRVSRLFNMKR